VSRHTELFLSAKRLLRANPGWDDARVAEELGVRAADQRSMDTITAARRDVEADS
jgi:hypothetical protein